MTRISPEWADQTRRMDQIRAEMTVLSYANASRMDREGGRTKPSGGGRPPGDPHPLHVMWWEKFCLVSTLPGAFERREEVIAGATDALVRARCGLRVKVEDETPEQRRERILKFEGWSPGDVAIAMRGSAREVIKARLHLKRDPSTGKPLGNVTAKQLAREGYSAREIAVIAGVSPSTGQYHVNRLREAA